MSDTIPTMKLKLHRVDGSLEVRRVGLRANTLEALRAAVDATFPDLEGKYDLLYVDADGDTCTLKTDEELAISFIARSDGAAELSAKAAEAMRDGDADTDVMAEMAKKFQEREGADGEPPCAFMAEMAEKRPRDRRWRARRAEAKEPPAPPAEAASPSSEWEEFISSDTAGVFEALKQLEEMGFVAKNGFEPPGQVEEPAPPRAPPRMA
ncbi:M16 peptidase-like protein [Aureococcus anophagefferens]|nr:M16 peptidase-like protein [Aureococcus anophagefferens]